MFAGDQIQQAMERKAQKDTGAQVNSSTFREQMAHLLMMNVTPGFQNRLRALRSHGYVGTVVLLHVTCYY